MPYQGHFDLNIPRAIHDQLLAEFEQLAVAPLGEATLTGTLRVTRRAGVYGLYRAGTPVYVGKAEDLGKRIDEHRFKLTGRLNVTLGEMAFKCLTVDPNWSAYAPERILITHYKDQDLCSWNGTGFGIHDPGRNRETTQKPPRGFDHQHPIRLDIPCTFVPADRYPVLELLLKMKERLPYLLRFAADDSSVSRRGHREYGGKHVDVPRPNMTPVELLQLIVEALIGWQATVFPSHVILYQEYREYEHAILTMRS